ncbi:hypothetical protein AS594_08770 [Streptomyces agglomeratus]|uniref:Uncharacterized protein n=1 Tax=Streptomyces agglomeratus TaxID=285458 RepID=A0A1E5P4W1_9ACTN|nr:hypothetical protein AS594_08770 [Streptomyces agglomeratus]
MAAQGEEAVVDADLVEVEDLGEQSGQDLFVQVAGCAVGVAGEFRLGQCPPVQLAVHRQRQRVKDHHCRRHHELRQLGGQELP